MSEKAFVGFADLPQVLLSIVLDKLDKEDQAACAAVCRDWLQAGRGRCQNLRVVLRPPTSIIPERAVDGDELRDLLERFPGITGLRIAGLAAADEVLPPLPPLPKLQNLDLGSCGLSSQPLSFWQLLQNLTSLSYTVRDCSVFTGEEVLLGLPLLQDLSVICLSGDLYGFLSKMPDMPALRGLSLSCYGNSVTKHSIEGSYTWMGNLERLQLRIINTEYERQFETLDQLPVTILESCSRVQHLSLATQWCTSGMIMKAAGLKFLRSLQVHAHVIEDCSAPEESAAWMQLRDKLTALCASEVCLPGGCFVVDENGGFDLRGLPSKLEALSFPFDNALIALDTDAASLTHLISLRQLGIDISALDPVEPLTALRGLTKLQIQLRTEVGSWAQREMERMQLLSYVPQLCELDLVLHLKAEWQPSFEVALLSGICQSSTEVNLGLYLLNAEVDLPATFVSSIGEQLVALRISFSHAAMAATDFRSREGVCAGWDISSLSCLARLQRLQLMFCSPPDFFSWLKPLEKQNRSSPVQLRYVCLLFSVAVDSAVMSNLIEALCSVFPSVVEVCIHAEQDTSLSLCASCLANKMDNYAWMDGSFVY